MKEKINALIDGLIVQDYILFGSVFILFLLLMVLAILLREKKALSIFLAIFALALFFLGPTLGYTQMHKFMFKNKVELLSEKKLRFTKAVVIHAKVTNLSNKNFSACNVKATAYRKTPNEYKNYIFRLKPIKKSSILTSAIDKNQTKEIKMFIEPFNYTKDYEIALQASCR